MRNVYLFILGIVIMSFILPLIFTNIEIKETIANIENAEDKNVETNNVEYSNYNTVKLLHVKTNEIEELNLDEYLLGVVSAEMPVSYDIEALKAQALVARTYTIYNIENNNKHEEADICDNYACCQAWISKEDRMERWENEEKESNWKKIEIAVNDTAGKIITYNGKAINAFFHSNSGGSTEMPINVWRR